MAPADVMLVKQGPISWIAKNHSKPGRGDAQAWLIHARNQWADTHMEADPVWVEQTLREAWSYHLQVDAQVIEASALHRWRFAVERHRGPRYLLDAKHRLIACGDWCQQGRL